MDLTTSAAVHYRLTHLGNASATTYLSVAFTDLSSSVYVNEPLSQEQMSQMASALVQHVPLVDIFATYVERCFLQSRYLPLTDACLIKLVEQVMLQDPPSVLRALLALPESLKTPTTRNLFTFIGVNSPVTALRLLLTLPLTSELKPAQFDDLFTANEQLRRGSRRVTRPRYLRTLIYQAMPEESGARTTALALCNEWHGNIESLLETCEHLSVSSPT